MILPLVFSAMVGAAPTDRTYTIHQYLCKNGKALGLVTFQPQPKVTMMAHFCAYALLDGNAPSQTVRDTCQSDKTDWAVKCFNDEFVPNCEDRDHNIKVSCFHTP